MADTRNLTLKGRTWWAQCAVPRPLRAVLGKSNLLLNLRTSDFRVAQRHRVIALAELQRRIEAAAGRPVAPPQSIQSPALMRRDAREQAEAGGDAEQINVTNDLLMDETYRLEEKEGEAAARRFYGIASGESTPVVHHTSNDPFSAHSWGTMSATTAAQKYLARGLQVIEFPGR